MNLLFDVHSSGNYFSNKPEIDKNHTVVCVGHHEELAGNSPDEKIFEFAKNNGFTIVTKDINFVKRCCTHNAKVAVLKGNYLFLIENAIQMFGQEPANRLFTYD
jgi:predicted nuclease of predicted toxin-antitoxin system